MSRSPVWETTVTDDKDKNNPHGVYSGLLITKDLFSTDDYAEAKTIKAWLSKVGFMCQWKIVVSSKIREIIKTTKKTLPGWHNFLADDRCLNKTCSICKKKRLVIPKKKSNEKERI